MQVPNTNTDNTNKKFTIQYTKEELDKITLDFVTKMNEYIARVNSRIIRTFEEIEKEAELFPPTTATIIVEQKIDRGDKIRNG